MADGVHLGDEVEIMTDSFASVGVPRGSLGVVTDDWADGSNDVEVRDERTGEVVANVHAAEGEVQPYSGPFVPKEPRRHGILFGRGDDLGAPAGDPPSPPGSQFGGLPGQSTGAWPIGEGSGEEADAPGAVPWELQEPPQTGPIVI